MSGMTDQDLDPTVRDALARRATRFNPTRGALAGVLGRVRRRERARRAGTAVLALGIFAAAAVLTVPRLLPGSDEGRPAGQPAPIPGPTPTGAVEDLWWRTFTSTKVTHEGAPRPLVPDTRIEVRFPLGLVSIQAGCNSYASEVQIRSDRLVLEEIVGTEVGCVPALHEQDGWLVEFFTAEPGWKLDGELLTLTSGATVIELRESESHQGQGVPPIFFPTLAEPATGYPDALAIGTLVQRRGCVFLEGTDGSRTLLIWPFGWSIQATEDGSLRVLDENGTPVREIGEEVELGGGFVGESRNRTGFPEELIGEPIPDRCKAGGYFLTSG